MGGAIEAAEVHHHHGHGPANRGRRVVRTSAPLLVRHPPGGGSRVRGAVLVLHGAAGLDEPVEYCCRTLASCGYVTVAPLFYYETGGPTFGPDTADAAFAALALSDLEADLAGALDYLGTRLGMPRRRVAAAGFGSAAHLAELAGADLAAALGPEPPPWPGAPVFDPHAPDRLVLPSGPSAVDDLVRFLDAGLPDSPPAA
ncbi:dienelactone hydrolase family protein [Amycolatopsis orientalis]|uniref:dienelactone hydrolase family protein n=1 Tax=Amycolatopsis orientalis TaxID=31958 RepID=UPI00039E2D57|nr:dienelactone hydrolase family protein [Amycolatopsis orientalis]